MVLIGQVHTYRVPVNSRLHLLTYSVFVLELVSLMSADYSVTLYVHIILYLNGCYMECYVAGSVCCISLHLIFYLIEFYHQERITGQES